MRIIIIGAVAGGTSAAAKARRNSEDAEIVIYEKDSFISYSGCGMPYYIGAHVDRFEDLVPRDADFFKKKYDVDVFTGHEVLDVDPIHKRVQVKNLTSGKLFTDKYDKLIIATGAYAVKPPIKGVDQDHVFTLRSITDMNQILTFLETRKPKTAVIIGTGFIGLELSENFTDRGIQVTMVERLPQVTPGLDGDMADYVQEYLEGHGVQVKINDGVETIGKEDVVLSSEEKVPAELVIVAAGIRPNVSLAKSAGAMLGVTGAIQVNHRMETSLPDIYACGDCIEHFHLVTGKPVWRPLGSTANKTGRIAGDCATGGDIEFRGILGTGIFKIFDLAVAQTGLSEREAKELGYDVSVSHNIKISRAEYLGGKELIIKGIADRNSGRLLGVQIVGEDGVDKRVDVFATAITFGAKAEDLFHLDLAYAPPFSTTKDPVMYTGMIMENDIHRGRGMITAEQLNDLLESGERVNVIDARIQEQYEKDHIGQAVNVPHEKIRCSCEALDPEAVTVTYCNKGVTGNAAQNILLNRGFKKVLNLSGGHKFYTMKKKD